MTDWLTGTFPPGDAPKGTFHDLLSRISALFNDELAIRDQRILALEKGIADCSETIVQRGLTLPLSASAAASALRQPQRTPPPVSAAALARSEDCKTPLPRPSPLQELLALPELAGASAAVFAATSHAALRMAIEAASVTPTPKAELDPAVETAIDVAVPAVAHGSAPPGSVAAVSPVRARADDERTEPMDLSAVNNALESRLMDDISSQAGGRGGGAPSECGSVGNVRPVSRGFPQPRPSSRGIDSEDGALSSGPDLPRFRAASSATPPARPPMPRPRASTAMRDARGRSRAERAREAGVGESRATCMTGDDDNESMEVLLAKNMSLELQLQKETQENVKLKETVNRFQSANHRLLAKKSGETIKKLEEDLKKLSKRHDLATAHTKKSDSYIDELSRFISSAISKCTCGALAGRNPMDILPTPARIPQKTPVRHRPPSPAPGDYTPSSERPHAGRALAFSTPTSAPAGSRARSMSISVGEPTTPATPAGARSPPSPGLTYGRAAFSGTAPHPLLFERVGARVARSTATTPNSTAPEQTGGARSPTSGDAAATATTTTTTTIATATTTVTRPTLATTATSRNAFASAVLAASVAAEPAVPEAAAADVLPHSSAATPLLSTPTVETPPAEKGVVGKILQRLSRIVSSSPASSAADARVSPPKTAHDSQPPVARASSPPDGTPRSPSARPDVSLSSPPRARMDAPTSPPPSTPDAFGKPSPALVRGSGSTREPSSSSREVTASALGIVRVGEAAAKAPSIFSLLKAPASSTPLLGLPKRTVSVVTNPDADYDADLDASQHADQPSGTQSAPVPSVLAGHADVRATPPPRLNGSPMRASEVFRPEARRDSMGTAARALSPEHKVPPPAPARARRQSVTRSSPFNRFTARPVTRPASRTAPTAGTASAACERSTGTLSGDHSGRDGATAAAATETEREELSIDEEDFGKIGEPRRGASMSGSPLKRKRAVEDDGRSVKRRRVGET